ncbi:MAG: hypothetical protein ACRDRV_04435 [Pseudonocardiaceae bacterium]
MSEILSGRQVLMYSVLRRIVTGLAIPAELAGLSWDSAAGSANTYAEEVMVADPEGVEAMLRRHLLAQGGIAIAGSSVAKLGELLGGLPTLTPVPLPSRVEAVHVTKVRHLTQQLRDAGRAHGSDPQVSRAVVAWATRLLDVSGADRVKRELMVAVGELHTVAGWSAFDAGLADHTMWHYARALDLAAAARDPSLQATALNFAGIATAEHGHPDDGLKMLQLGRVKSWEIPRDDNRRSVVQSCSLGESAVALADLGYSDAARAELAKARELWQPTAPYGDPNSIAALLELGCGRLDAAEPFAAASLRHWDGVSHRARAQSSVTLATIHVRAGDSGGLSMAHGAITSVGKLSSARTRKRLQPLADALDTRPGTDARDLARQARQVATTRV